MSLGRANQSAPCADGAAGIRPLLSVGLRVLVDGHPICAVCGGAVRPTGPDEWRHAPRGGSKPPRISTGEAASLASYSAFRARFPWAAATEDEWREGVGRLGRFRAQLASSKNRRRLRLGENPFLELVTGLAAGMAWQLSPGLAQILDLSERRRELASMFSWAIPTEQALAVLAKHAPLVECGAGMGYWTALLQARGVDAVAYDLLPPGGKARNEYHRQGRHPWIEVQRASAATAARRHRDRALLLCWPPYDDDAASYAALRAYRGDLAIHIGERDEGATGSVRFHRELHLNWTLIEEVDLPHWPNLRDRLMVYRRNPRRLPHRERDRCFECGCFIPTGAIGRCETCFELRPPALALRVGRHRMEYPQELVDAMPPALRKAFESSPARIR
jgi:hypothetical protein